MCVCVVYRYPYKRTLDIGVNRGKMFRHTEKMAIYKAERLGIDTYLKVIQGTSPEVMVNFVST